MWWQLAVGLAISLIVIWGLLLLALWRAAPGGTSIKETLRLLPDVLRVVHRLAADESLPRGVRMRLWLLLAYLALPFDIVPDFIPVVGYADDVIMVALVLRSVTRRAGPNALARHWPGSPEGLAAVMKLVS